MDAEQTVWRESVEAVMGRIVPILPPTADEVLAEQRLEHLAHITTLMQRFGAGRSDPIASVLSHLGNYWAGGILVMLHIGPMRPSTLQRLLTYQVPDHPISKRMLRLNLRALEDDGLIEHEVRDARRAHVEYRLTPLGQGFARQFLAVIDWCAQHGEQIMAVRRSRSAALAHADDPLPRCLREPTPC